MQISQTSIAEVKIIVPSVLRDERGYFVETYNRSALARIGIDHTFVQDNLSHSDHSGVVRGLHFQTPPHAQGKLVRVVRGAIFDVAVDLRHGSPTYGHSVSMLLDSDGQAQAWIPVGFAHGFCTLLPGTEVFYKVTTPYAPMHDRGLAWDDMALGIDWPVERDKAILSAKDRTHPKLKDLPAYFHYGQETENAASA